MATWILGALCREKALSKFPNGSMIKNGLSCPGTQGDWLTNEEKLAPTFSIRGLEKVLDTTFKKEKVTTLRWRTNKGCSPCVEASSSTLGSKSVKWSGWMASNSNLGTGSVFMCQEVKGPLSLAWAVPEVNWVIRVIGKEVPKSLDNSKGVGLAWVNRNVNCSPSCSLFTTSFDYIWGWKELGISENLE